MVSIGFEVGARVPAHVVTPGVVLPATLPDDELAAWAEAHEFSAFTSRTVTERRRFLAEVRAARVHDYWIVEQQLDAGLTGVALALKDRRARCKGSIGMTLQVAAWPRERIAELLVPALREVAQTLRPIL